MYLVKPLFRNKGSGRHRKLQITGTERNREEYLPDALPLEGGGFTRNSVNLQTRIRVNIGLGPLGVHN